MRNDTFACPNCGEMLPNNAKVCRSCGSDEFTGWSDNTYLDGIDLPFEDDDYDDIREREFGGTSAQNGRVKNSFRIDVKMIIGLLVLVAMLFSFVFTRC